MPASTVKQMCDPGRGDYAIDERWVSIDAYTMASFSPSNAAYSPSSTPLEVETLGGYAAIWLAVENPSLHVTTIEFNPHHADVACENIKAAGVGEQVEVILGAGMDVLQQLHEDIQAGERERVGFKFVGANEVNNWNYVDWAIEMSLPRGCIVVDNVVAKGELVDAVSSDRLVVGGREVVERVGRDERADGTVLQTVR